MVEEAFDDFRRIVKFTDDRRGKALRQYGPFPVFSAVPGQCTADLNAHTDCQ